MTQRSVTYLKAKFETNDVPTQSDYQDIFDSFLSLEASGAQTLNGPLVFTSVESTHVSAANITVNALNVSTASAGTVYVDTKLINSHTINVSAGLGTQAGATRITKDVSLVFGNDVLGFGVVLATADPGRIQIITNTNTTVLSVYPASGANFIGTAENAPITLAKNSTMTIAHVGASAYGITRGTI